MSSGNVRKIEDLIHSRARDLPELKLALTRFLSELQDREASGSPNSEAIFFDALRTLPRIRGIALADLRLKCLDRCGHYFYVSGNAMAAVQACTHMSALAKAIDDKQWIRLSESTLGIAYADLGNIAESIIHHSNAYEVAKEIGHKRAVVSVLLNLGVALTYAGLFREAIPYFQTVRVRGTGLVGAEGCIDAAKTDLAQAYLYLGDFREGLQTIAQLDIQGDHPIDSARALSLTIREVTYTQLALEVRDYDLARERAQKCRGFANWSGSVRSLLLAQFVDGMCDVHFGNVERGLKLLDDCALRGGDTPAYSLTLGGAIRAFELAGQPDKALLKLFALQEHVRAMRSNSALALLSANKELTSHLQSDALAEAESHLQQREFRLRALAAEAQIFDAQVEMLDRLAVTADLREESSGEHGYRVGRLSSTFASEIGWTKEQCFMLDIAARLHDIGKIGVPDRILLNSQELKDAERHLMSTHTLIGSELLAKSNIPQLRMAEEIARCHHEWWNGTGYPARLSGKRIPIHARIVALADVFDAMTHGRPYSEPWDIDRALAEIQKLRGEQFDPDLTDRFIALVQRLRGEHADLDEFLGRAGRNSPFLKARHKIREMLAAEQARELAATGDLVAH